MPMYVYQCPECNLKFAYATEMEQHLSLDHPDFEVTPKTIEDSLMSASHRPRHAGGYKGENR
jgi:predicted nucleic acid-binding Zn ribbon protein